MSALAGDWIWGDPRILWLLPLALIPLLAPRAQRRRVASTSLWRSVPGARAPLRPLPRVLAIAALLVAAASPALISDPERTRIPSGAEASLELAIRRVDGAHVIDHGAIGAGALRLESESGERWGEGPADLPGSIALPAEAGGARGRIVLPSGRAIGFSVPAAPPIPTVRDRSGSPAVAAALAALAETGRIARAAADDPRSAAVEIGSGNVLVDTGASEGAAARILFPSPGSERPRLLPVPAAGGAGWLAGLAPERFTIYEAAELPRTLVPALSDRDGAPLIAEGAAEIRFSFRPEQSDLPGRAEWPVLLGRAIERLAPEPFIPAPASPLPALLAALVALGTWPFAARSRRERLLGAAVIAGALLLPPIPALAPGRATLGSGPPATALERAAASLAGGGAIEVPASSPLPFEEERVAAHLAARRAGIVVAPAALPAIAVRPGSIPLGARAEVISNGGHAGPVEGTRPDGVAIPLGDLAPGEALGIVPSAAGVWVIRSPGVAPALLEVVAPIALVEARGGESGGGGSGAPAVLLDSGAFRRESEPAGTTGAAFPVLPDPPETGLLVWEDAEPAALAAVDAARLRDWLEAGGTLFAVAAPPFRGAEEPTALDPLLPLPLPAPPRPPRRDHGVLLIDLSGSVAGEALAALWSGVVALVEGAPRGDRIAIAGFREEVRWIIPPGAPLDAAALERVRGSLAAGGGTRLDTAIAFARAAIDGREDLSRQIIVITDGRGAGADWPAIGGGLREARIGLVAVHLSEGSAGSGIADPGREILRELCAAAAGTLRSARGPGEAVRLLAEAIDPPREPWRASAGALRGAGAFAEGWPGAIEGPRRRLESPAITPEGTRPLLVDGSGEPLAWWRAIGKGRAILLWSGLDAESLPAGRASDRFRSAFAAALARAVRGAPVERRPLRVRIDRTGRPRLVAERAAGDPPVVEGRALSPAGEATAVRGRAHGASWEIEGIDASAVCASIEIAGALRTDDSTRSPVLTGATNGVPETGEAAWRALAARIAPPPERALLHLERIVWAGLALLLALGRRPQADTVAAPAGRLRPAPAGADHRRSPPGPGAVSARA